MPRYRITVRGRLTARLAPAFSPMTMEAATGRTALVGELEDQAQLFGVLGRLCDLGIELLGVELLGVEEVSR